MASTYINIPNANPSDLVQNVVVTNVPLPVTLTSSSIEIGTVDQGSPNTIANAWPVKPTDGTNSQSYTAGGAAKVDGSATIQPVSQSGSWDILNITGTISLPTGASTSALQVTGNASLSSIDGKLNSLGQKTMAASVPVVIASDQSTLSVSVSNFPVTLDTNYGVVGASTLRTASEIGNSTGAAAFGAGTTTAQVLRVVLPTDQTAIPATQSGTWTVQQGTPPWSFNQTQVNGVAVSTGNGVAGTGTQRVTIASDNTAFSVNATIVENANPWYNFGQVATAATTQTVVMKTAFTYTGSNVSAFIASGSANDTLAGTGAQKITITYFKADGSGPFTETDNMQGLTGFFTSNTMAFIQSVVVSQVGSGGSNAGQILVSNLVPLSTMAAIAAGDNETYYCHHFVPLGKTAYITNFSFGGAATAAGQGAQFLLKKQNIPLSGSPILSTIGTMTLVGTSSTQPIVFPEPVKVAGPAVITTQLIPDSATANTFFAAIGGYEQ